ncbi:cuticle protein 16.8-like, partial [Ornithodoros turicata]|uniref:cuticle protein 16.8-like n=1 Tax=Ornithodoros turicata TaxID=34597 RepID=UPI0031397B51
RQLSCRRYTASGNKGPQYFLTHPTTTVNSESRTRELSRARRCASPTPGVRQALSLLAVILTTASAGITSHGGTSTQHRHQDDYGNYQFSYDIVDPYGASNGRWEVGDAFGNKRGGYTITDIDGRKRRVEYVADKYGFRVVVNTNEPGTAASVPGAAVYNSPYINVVSGIGVVNKPVYAAATVPAVHVAPAPVHAAPVRKVPASIFLNAPVAKASAHVPVYASLHQPRRPRNYYSYY